MGRSLLDTATTFTVRASGQWNQRGPVGERVAWSLFQQQQLCSLWLDAPCICSNAPSAGGRLPRFPCCCWAAVPAMGLNRTISSLLCCLAPQQKGQIFGGRKGFFFPLGKAPRSLHGLALFGVIQVLMLLISHAFRISNGVQQRNKQCCKNKD